MIRFYKYFCLMMALLLTFSLIGCSSASVTSQKNESEVEQNVEDNEIKVNSVIVSNDSDENMIDTGSASNKKDELIKVEEVASETKKEQSSTVTVVEPKQKVSPTKKEAEKTETTSKTDKKNPSKTTTTKEVTQKDSETTPVKETKPTNQIEPKPSVSITISGPSDFGVILPKSKVNISEGDTVLDVLLKAAKKNNILVEHSGSGAMAYIEGIDNIYEFDYGPKSGWNFKLNGTTISKSSGIVKVKKDDVIEWVYSEDFTEGNE
jgi:hypothetical protein